MNLRRALLAVAASLALTTAAAAEEAPRIIGLLVGASDYETDPLGLGALSGPRNDVLILGDVLVERGAEPADLTILTTRPEAADYRPSAPLEVSGPPDRAGVISALMALIERARPGDQVVIQLAGHGWRQSERVAGSEIDGFDEVFLPSDYGRGMGARDPLATDRVSSALLDDEIGAAVDRLRARGADVIFVGDFCHSGDSTRGRPVLDGPRPEPRLEVAEASVGHGAYTAFFAAPSDGRAMQGLGPIWAEGEARAPYGLLSLYLATALRDPGLASWSDVAGRVQASLLEHDVRDRSVRLDAPAEFEGDLDRLVLGQGAGLGARWTVLKPALDIVDGRAALAPLTLNAGALHGLTEDSIVALSETRDGVARPVLYGRAVGVGPASSRLVPTSGPGVDASAWTDLRAPDGRPYTDERLWTATVRARAADFNFRVAVPPDAGDLVGAALAGLRAEDLTLELVAPDAEADLYLRRTGDGLVLAQGRDPALTGQAIGSIDLAAVPVAEGDGDEGEIYLRQAIADALIRAGRAERVRRVLAMLGDGGGAADGLDIEHFLWRPRATAADGACPAFDPEHAALTDQPPPEAASFAALGLNGPPTLRPCDVIFTRIENTGEAFLDVTPLALSADAAIWALPWMDGRPAERFEPGRARMTAVQLNPADPARVPNEELVVIAVEADRQGGAPASFARLAQPPATSLQPMSPAELSRSGDMTTPLMALFDEARFGAERSGAVPAQPERVSVSRLAWRVAAE